MKNLLLMIACLLIWAVACQNNTVATPDNTPIPTVSAPVPATDVPATNPPQPTSTVPPTEDATEVNALPASSVFDMAWTDTTPYDEGLIASEQDALEMIDTASVYHIDVTVSDDYFNMSGKQAVRYTNQEDGPLNEVYFHLYPNIMSGETVIHNLMVNEKAVTPSYEVENSVMRVPLEPALQPGEQVVIQMDMDVEIPTIAGGNYGIFAFQDDILAIAHFYPMISVYDDEGWNIELPAEAGDLVYSDVSFYLVRITTPLDFVITAGGTAISHEETDTHQSNTYALGPARDFYFAGSPFYKLRTRQVGEVTINSYALPEFGERSELVLDYAEDSIKSFNTRYGTYPYTELDFVSTSTLALGIEYPGIIVITNRAYFRYPLEYLESTTAHEVAHQWFYGTVGNDQLDEPWVDESVTQYATLMYYLDTHGQSGYDGFRETLTSRFDNSTNKGLAVGLPVSAYDGRDYSGIIYGRGPLFVEALAQEMGQDTFDAFIKDYAQSNQWHISSTETFRAMAEEHCGCDLTDIFNEWVYQIDN